MSDYEAMFLLRDGRNMTVEEMKTCIYELEDRLEPWLFQRQCQDDEEGNPGVVYTPWTDGSVVGWRARHIESGEVEYIYLNPSHNDAGSDVPNVFLYHGETGDAGTDGCWHHYTMFDSIYRQED